MEDEDAIKKLREMYTKIKKRAEELKNLDSRVFVEIPRPDLNPQEYR